MKTELDVIKNCKTCAHRKGISFNYAMCMKSGYYCTIERRYPTACGRDFSGWQQRLTLLQRLINMFKF